MHIYLDKSSPFIIAGGGNTAGSLKLAGGDVGTLWELRLNIGWLAQPSIDQLLPLPSQMYFSAEELQWTPPSI